MPLLVLDADSSVDGDLDGMADFVEQIHGTDPNNPDTDGDGIPDGVELQQGTDPLSNLAVRTGTIANVDTPGNALDVCAVNNLAVVADSEKGVSIFNVFNGLTPTLVSQVPTSGSALRVACSGNLVAVAEGPEGLEIIDVSSPSNAQVIRHLNLGDAVAIAVQGGIAYAGLSSGLVVVVDMAGGEILDQKSFTANIRDVAVQGGTLAVVGDSQTSFAQIVSGEIQEDEISTLANGGSRIFLANDLAYVTFRNGFFTVNIADPLRAVVIAEGATGQVGWQQIVPNGSGLGIAAAGVIRPEDLYLYDLSNPADDSRFLTTLNTPGEPRAVSIYNGLAYVADGSSGLTVVNYLAYDNKKTPPTISLSASFPLEPAQVEEGKLAILNAKVADDVQVRNVEFYVDGQKVLTDGNFPFELAFTTPVSTQSKTTFTLRAKATDTGGNTTWTDEITVALVKDATPPRVRRTIPAKDAFPESVQSLFVYFSESVDVTTLTPQNFHLIYAGSDNHLDTPDDQPVAGRLEFRDSFNAGVLSFAQPLPFGLYHAFISSNITDLAGLHLASNLSWNFWILPGGVEGDDDGDGLTNAEEVARGTNPFLKDTDGDSWADGDELVDGFDPLDPRSHPQMIFIAAPVVEMVVPSLPNPENTGLGIVVANPPLEVVVPSSTGESLAELGLTVAQPTVEIVLPSVTGEGVGELGLTVATPPLEIVVPSISGEGGAEVGLTVAHPPIEVVLPSSKGEGVAEIGTTVATPPVEIVVPSATGNGLFDSGLFTAQPPVEIKIPAGDTPAPSLVGPAPRQLSKATPQEQP